MCTRQSQKVIWDMINTLFLTTLPVEPTFVAFLQQSQTHFVGLLYQFFQISLKNSELKTTHNAFQDCRVHFFRRPFSKQLYIPCPCSMLSFSRLMLGRRDCVTNQKNFCARGKEFGLLFYAIRQYIRFSQFYLFKTVFIYIVCSPHFIPGLCFTLGQQFLVLILHLLGILYPVRSLHFIPTDIALGQVG